MQIDPRFNGPPDSANGGYTCGLMASVFGHGVVEVTLRKPPPLGQPLLVSEHRLWQGEELVAEARLSTLELDVPEPPSPAEARLAGQNYEGLRHHPFPTCFVCGHRRPARDGLEVFAGAVEGRDLVAAEWIPPAEFSDGSGYLRSEFLWCALDCPGAWSLLQSVGDPVVLGRLTASIEGRLPIGSPAIVVGWSLGRDGRKAFAGTAVFDSQGVMVARAKAVWISLPQPRATS